jgi:hypothetical protein
MVKLLIKHIFSAIAVFLYFSCTPLIASPPQSKSPEIPLMDNNDVSIDSVKGSVDIVDIFDKKLNITLRHDTAMEKTNGPFLSVLPAVGYALQSGLTGTVVANISFFTDNKHNKFSHIYLNGNISQYQQYWFSFNNSVFIDKLKLHLMGDNRYYNFPTKTYGLGSNSSPNNPMDIDYSYIRIYQVFCREAFKNIFVGLGYGLDHHWNIKASLLANTISEEFEKLEPNNHSTSSGFIMNIMFDSRRNAANPQNGSYIHVQYRPNLTILESDKNWQSMRIDIRHYIKFPASSKNFIGLWSYNDITLSGEPPYLDLPSVGWDDYSNTGRGYVPGRYRDRNLFYFESEYRFSLTRNGLLGGVVFGNAETLLQKIPSNIQKIIPGYGIGLRVKVNKYSNTNLAIDYGFGTGGSHGFFFNLGEVF